MPTYAVAIAPVHRHFASGSVREIGAGSIILGERQHYAPTFCDGLGTCPGSTPITCTNGCTIGVGCN